MTQRLSGKVALVMGAGSVGPGWGNGKATAVHFAREGARVFCVDIDEAAARETAEMIRREGGSAEWHRADVARGEDVVGAVEACTSAFGGIDVLDNNVGILEVGGVVEMSEESWDRVLAVNLKGCFLAMKHVIPAMLERGGGSVVNISSIAAIRSLGVPYASYYASKAAVSHLTRATAIEYAGRGIRVNAVLPGLMKTPMVERSAALAQTYGGSDVEEMWRERDRRVPMGRMGDAWDVARAALFLACDESRYVTGIELVVDGGYTLRTP